MIDERQRKIIRSLKGFGDEYVTRSISIINDRNTVIGSLKPIDIKLCRDNTVISSLTKWRRMFMRYFLTQFNATEERTRAWLNSFIMEDDSRILFLIMDETEKAIGNFGIRDISQNSAQLDNLIRGESGGGAKLVFFSEVSLICWVYRILNIDDIYLHVFSNNLRTILLHESVGFLREDVYRLIRQENNGEVSYVVDYSNEPAEDEFGLMKMALDKGEFFSKHSWLERKQ